MKFRRSARIFSITLALLLISTMLLGYAQTAPAAAQTDKLTSREFRDLVKDVESDDPAFGPENGDLPLDPDVVTLEKADVDLENVLIEATFTNPYAGDDSQFDIGIQFRSATANGESAFLRLIVVSTGVFGVTETGADDLLLTGTYDDLDLSRNGENDLTVYADGDQVHVAINGDYVGSATTSLEDAGDVAVGTAFIGDSFQEGKVTGYDNFTVWEIGDSSSGSSSTKSSSKKTPTASDDEPTKSPSKKKTPTPSAEGNVFTSEVFDFAFRYDDEEWQLGDPAEADGVELLSLFNGTTTYLQIVESTTFDTPEDCLTGLTNLFVTSLTNLEVEADLDSGDGLFPIDSGPRAGSIAIEISVSVTSGDLDDSTGYIECGPVGDSAYLVGVTQLVPQGDYKKEAVKRQEIIDTFNATDEPDPEPTKTGSKTGGTKTAGGKKISDHVVATDDGALYTSPSFGITVGILDGYTVEEDSVQNGYDTLVVSESNSRVTYSMYTSNNSADGCIASIINNLSSDGSIANFQIATTNDGEELKGNGDGYSYVVVAFTAGGQDLARYYACFGGSGAILVFAYETPYDAFSDRIDDIETMLGQVTIP